MSLINDALRRASKTAKERPPEAPTPMGMEPVPPAKNSRSNAVLGILVVVVLVLAGWFFWQWWTARTKAQNAAMAKTAQPAIPKPGSTNAVAPKPSGTILMVPEKKPLPPAVATAAAAPAPTVAETASVAAATTAPIAAAEPPPAAPAEVITPKPPAAAPATAPVYVDEHITLPVDLSVSAILYNQSNPHALINGQLYGIGDVIQGGVTIKAIERNRVIMEWAGHTKILMVGE